MQKLRVSDASTTIYCPFLEGQGIGKKDILSDRFITMLL
jgi:hypothetical protein